MCNRARLDTEFASKDVLRLTTVESDFDRAVTVSTNINLLEISKPVLFVVKKNKSRLENRIDWLKQSCVNGQNYIKRSLLLIDDEADNASINTNDMDKTDDPTAINGCIREILKLFYQTTYIGITATPFANIFIDPDNDNASI